MYTNFRSLGTRPRDAASPLPGGNRSTIGRGGYGRTVAGSHYAPLSNQRSASPSPPPPSGAAAAAAAAAQQQQQLPSVVIVGLTTEAMHAWPALHAAGFRVAAVAAAPAVSGTDTTLSDDTNTSAVVSAASVPTAHVEAFIRRCIETFQVPELPTPKADDTPATANTTATAAATAANSSLSLAGSFHPSSVPLPLAGAPTAAKATATGAAAAGAAATASDPLRGVIAVPSVTALLTPSTRMTAVGGGGASGAGSSSLDTTPLTTPPAPAGVALLLAPPAAPAIATAAAAATLEPELGFSHILDATDLIYIATQNDFAFTVPPTQTVARTTTTTTTAGVAQRLQNSFGTRHYAQTGREAAVATTAAPAVDTTTNTETAAKAGKAAAVVANREGFLRWCAVKGKHVVAIDGLLPTADAAALIALLEATTISQESSMGGSSSTSGGVVAAPAAVRPLLEDAAIWTLALCDRLKALTEAMALPPVVMQKRESTPAPAAAAASEPETAAVVPESTAPAAPSAPPVSRPVGRVHRLELVLCVPAGSNERSTPNMRDRTGTGSGSTFDRETMTMDALLRRGVGFVMALMRGHKPAAVLTRVIPFAPTATTTGAVQSDEKKTATTAAPSAMEVGMYFPVTYPADDSAEGEVNPMPGDGTITAKLFLSVAPRGPALTQDLTISGTLGTLEMHNGILTCAAAGEPADTRVSVNAADGDDHVGVAQPQGTTKADALVLVRYLNEITHTGTRSRTRQEECLYSYKPPTATAATVENAAGEATAATVSDTSTTTAAIAAAVAACTQDENGSRRLAFWRAVRRQLQPSSASVSSVGVNRGLTSSAGSGLFRGSASPYSSRYSYGRGSGHSGGSGMLSRSSMDAPKEQIYGVADADAAFVRMQRLIEVQAVADTIMQAAGAAARATAAGVPRT